MHLVDPTQDRVDHVVVVDFDGASGFTNNVSVDVGDISITEGNSSTKSAVFPVTIMLSPPAVQTLTVQYDYATANGTATAGTDYEPVSQFRSLTLPGMETLMTFNIPVPVIGETVYEPDEVFYLDVTVSIDEFGIFTTASDRGQCTILNDDPPPGPVITGVSDDTGTPGDGITSDRTLCVNGTSQPSADTPSTTITVYRDGWQIGTAEATPSGAWTFDYTSTSLPDGQYVFTATAKDTLNDVSAMSAPYIVVVDGTAPFVSGLVTNDGNAQRSMIKSLTLTFNEAVDLSGGAISLKMHDGSAVPNTTLNVANPSRDKMTFVCTFSGSAITGGSLADGIYDLIVDAGLALDRAGNPLGAAFSRTFHRLFGDFDGNMTVNNADYFKFKSTYGRSSGDVLYLRLFDYDDNGVINNSDYFQFKRRYGWVFNY